MNTIMTPAQLATINAEHLADEHGATLDIEHVPWKVIDGSSEYALSVSQGDSTIIIDREGRILDSEAHRHKLATLMEGAGFQPIAEDIRDCGEPLYVIADRLRVGGDDGAEALALLCEHERGEPTNPARRLEYLRAELRAERISYGELAELQSLAEHIEPGDVELLEAAGVPEFPEDASTDTTERAVYSTPGAMLRYAPGSGELDPTYWQIEVENGPNIVTHRTDGNIWHVGILTEDFPKGEAQADGVPYLSVSLNDATIYSLERDGTSGLRDNELASIIDNALRTLNERAEGAEQGPHETRPQLEAREDDIRAVCDAWDAIRENYR